MMKVKSKWLCKLLIATGLIHKVTKYFKLASRSLEQVLDDITNDKELKAVLAYSFGDYGK